MHKKNMVNKEILKQKLRYKSLRVLGLKKKRENRALLQTLISAKQIVGMKEQE